MATRPALVPVGPGVPPGVVGPLKSHEDALRALQVPKAPGAVFTTTSAALPTAKDYAGCVAWASDLRTLVISDGAEWIRQDTGANV